MAETGWFNHLGGRLFDEGVATELPVLALGWWMRGEMVGHSYLI